MAEAKAQFAFVPDIGDTQKYSANVGQVTLPQEFNYQVYKTGNAIAISSVRQSNTDGSLARGVLQLVDAKDCDSNQGLPRTCSIKLSYTATANRTPQPGEVDTVGFQLFAGVTMPTLFKLEITWQAIDLALENPDTAGQMTYNPDAPSDLSANYQILNKSSFPVLLETSQNRNSLIVPLLVRNPLGRKEPGVTGTLGVSFVKSNTSQDPGLFTCTLGTSNQNERCYVHLVYSLPTSDRLVPGDEISIDSTSGFKFLVSGDGGQLHDITDLFKFHLTVLKKIYLAVGARGTVLQSTDNAKTFTKLSNTGIDATDILNGIAVGEEGAVVIVGSRSDGNQGKIYVTSSYNDAQNPVFKQAPLSSDVPPLNAVAYSGGSTPYWVAVGDNGKIYQKQGKDPASDNNWFPVEQPNLPSADLMALASNGNGSLVAVGRSGTVLTSIAGSGWQPATVQNADSAGDFLGVVFNKNKTTDQWAAVSANAKVYTCCTSGADWLDRTQSGSNLVGYLPQWAVGVIGQTYILVGKYGTTITQQQGGSAYLWAARPSTPVSTESTWAILCDDVICIRGGTNGLLEVATVTSIPTNLNPASAWRPIIWSTDLNKPALRSIVGLVDK